MNESATMSAGDNRGGRRANIRLALVLAVVAVAFYVGIIMLRHP